MVDAKNTHDSTPYTLGIVSIVLSFFQPLAALIIGIVGFYQSKKIKDGKARKLNIWGIVLSVIVLIVTLIITYYAFTKGLTNLPALS